MKSLKLIGRISIASLLLTVMLTSCKKYDEGPAFSLKSKAERITNKWKVEQAILSDGQDLTNEWKDASLEFKKNGRYTIIKFSPDQSMKSEEVGSWGFTNKKEYIGTIGTEKEIMTVSGQVIDEFSTDVLWKITKLKEDELWIWLLYTDGKHEELRLKPL